MKRGVAGLLLASILAPVAVWAAGGAHIVDDSEVETPGVCHVESWVSLFMTGDGVFNAAPACTFRSLPMIEIGAGYQHYWDTVINAPLFGPQFKINFRSEESGLGFGLGLNAAVNLTTGDLGAASLLALVTLPIDDKVRFNFNAGWSYARYVDNQNALFYGAQVEAKVGGDFLLMVEVFGRTQGDPGSQTGLRYTPKDGPIDFDFLIGGLFDVAGTRFISFGVTLRY